VGVHEGLLISGAVDFDDGSVSETGDDVSVLEVNSSDSSSERDLLGLVQGSVENGQGVVGTGDDLVFIDVEPVDHRASTVQVLAQASALPDEETACGTSSVEGTVRTEGNAAHGSVEVGVAEETLVGLETHAVEVVEHNTSLTGGDEEVFGGRPGAVENWIGAALEG
jgi:hypothetical protein